MAASGEAVEFHWSAFNHVMSCRAPTSTARDGLEDLGDGASTVFRCRRRWDVRQLVGERLQPNRRHHLAGHLLVAFGPTLPDAALVGVGVVQPFRWCLHE